MKPFWTRLAKKEKRHLHSMDIKNIAAFERTRDHQVAQEAIAGDNYIACWECRSIARKTGVGAQ